MRVSTCVCKQAGEHTAEALGICPNSDLGLSTGPQKCSPTPAQHSEQHTQPVLLTGCAVLLWGTAGPGAAMVSVSLRKAWPRGERAAVGRVLPGAHLQSCSQREVAACCCSWLAAFGREKGVSY